MGFLSVVFGNLSKGKNMFSTSISSGSVLEPKPQALPTDLKDFKRWHYKALRRMNGHIIGTSYQGLAGLEVDFQKFAPILRNMGLIREGTWQESLSFLKVDDLKKILRENSLKVSGSKNDLIERICSSVSYDSVVSCGYGQRVYLHTEAGKDALEKSFAILEAEDLALFSVHFKLIYDGRLDEAYRSICMEKASMPVPPGIGFDWQEGVTNGIPESDLSLYSKRLKSAKRRDVAALSIYCSISGVSESEASCMYSKMLQIAK